MEQRPFIVVYEGKEGIEGIRLAEVTGSGNAASLELKRWDLFGDIVREFILRVVAVDAEGAQDGEVDFRVVHDAVYNGTMN